VFTDKKQKLVKTVPATTNVVQDDFYTVVLSQKKQTVNNKCKCGIFEQNS